MTTELAEDAGTVVPFTGLRRTAAKRMVQAWAAPVFHLGVDVDMGPLTERRAGLPGVSVTDLLVAAAAVALVAHPEVNATVSDDAVTTFERANVGIAVATPKGLMVPVVHEADRIGLAGIAERRADLVARARDGRLAMADVTGGTFSISNLGMMGIDRFDAILNAPQAAILAVGRTVQRQVFGEDGPVWRPMASLTFTFDHRAVDGATGAAFVADMVAAIQA